jgi:predicted dehydrogenase
LLLALLGLDDQTLAIAAAAVRSGRHRIAMVCALPPNGLDRLAAEGISAVEAAPWESLMVGGKFDAVVVASADDEAVEELRTEQLRKLVQEGVPLLTAHPVLSSMLACYEIDMIRRESQCILLPYLPARWDPAIARLFQLLRDPEQSPIGAIEQVVFERADKDRSRRAVLSHFARDVDVIRAIAGEVTRIGALGSPATSPFGAPSTRTDASHAQSGYANLTVQMSGEGSTVIRWSIGPVDDDPGGWLKIIGTKDRLEMAPPGEGLAEPQIAELAALVQLEHAIEQRLTVPDFTFAIRDIELAEAIPRSLARGRTIEVQHEQPTEEGTFKGLMTSLGCGLLLVGLTAIVVLAMLDAVARANNWRTLSAVLRPWPWVLCGVFGVFLAMQVLLRLTKRGERNDGQGRPE